ncbi:hypothetical protein [Falsiroseomonas selenitidurans]|uniref:Uncharacterized protein n=1 Tax=Falsiroseomonas selenitidurans TaxID=2716335 RepID=A0ABX1E958_9PROT|nr:hypothetical protein [Falsiroseomonas selenitidurans]NKC33483.1 hypothetical protein [Falsiroseomonas selenitidurans]
MRRLMLLALVASLPAAAHQAPSGWDYDQDCCHTRDCAPVPDGAVAEVAGGYRVRVMPGSHPMLPPGAPPVDAFVPHGDRRIRVSGDEDRHACLSRGGAVLCVYVPPGGV